MEINGCGVYWLWNAEDGGCNAPIIAPALGDRTGVLGIERSGIEAIVDLPYASAGPPFVTRSGYGRIDAMMRPGVDRKLASLTLPHSYLLLPTKQ